MNSYQIFLASSINEFKETRNDIGDFIRKVNDILIDYEMKIKLFECEFFDNTVAISRKQEEYNEEIRKSQVFLMLVGKSLGQYTKEEYEVAINSKVPQIYIIFKDIEQTESVKEFKNNIELSASISSFRNQRDINFNLANIIKEILKDKINVEIQEDRVYIEKESVKY